MSFVGKSSPLCRPPRAAGSVRLTALYFLAALGTARLRSRCREGPLPLESLRESAPAPPSCPSAGLRLWHLCAFPASRDLLRLARCFSRQKHPLNGRPATASSYLSTSAVTLFQTASHSETRGVRTLVDSFAGDTSQHTTGASTSLLEVSLPRTQFTVFLPSR